MLSFSQVYLVIRRSFQSAAFQASEVSAGAEAIINDFGRTTDNWISAFEILIHSGDDGYARQTRSVPAKSLMSEEFTQVEERGIAIYFTRLRKRHKSDGGYINPILGRGGDPEGTARIMAETYRSRKTYSEDLLIEAV